MKRKNGERITLKNKQTWAWKISLTKKEENDDDETCNKATMAKKQAAIVKAAAKWYSETCIMQNYLKPWGGCKILINKRDYNKLNGKATAKDEDKNRIN